jgi:hypothetical protein
MLLDINEEETYHEENKQEISIQTVQLESQATTKADVLKLGKSCANVSNFKKPWVNTIKRCD